MKKTLLLLVCLFCAELLLGQPKKDWANYGRYEQANAELTTRPDVVFMGNSITEGWFRAHPKFFTEHNYAARGISGQVTSQMLCRFRSDVLNLAPKAVVILAGTNDIAQNQGPISLEHIYENIVSMAELARMHKIRVVICSVLPAADYRWNKGLDPAPKIVELNSMLKKYAEENRCFWVDFHTPMKDEQDGLRAEYTQDGVHPLPAGYTVMEEIIAPVLRKAAK